jgi:hypothetical protein
MVPWNKMPRDLQKAILAMIIVFGGVSASCRLKPMVCDPPPPPATTPMIFDPPPPPSSTPQPKATPTRTPTPPAPTATTPMIFDPPPPPSSTPTPTATTPMIFDPPPPPSATPTTPMICDPAPPPSSTPKPQAMPTTTVAPLPLAEIRTVDIVWQGGLAFAAETPWPGARYRWSVSGGALVEGSGSVVWQPPAEPGRYLLQVVADWGRTGLAVDAVVLVVEDDGSVTLC